MIDLKQVDNYDIKIASITFRTTQRDKERLLALSQSSGIPVARLTRNMVRYCLDNCAEMQVIEAFKSF